MLYLAEVQKQKVKSGFMGSAKAELKLLAYQRADQSWTPVPGEEAIAAEEVNHLNPGALVLADLNPNRQVQQVREAGRPLVGILQAFSRQLEKSKAQEEEIEQWKQSLTYQSEELNRRNMEMEARLDQLQHIEEDVQRLEVQQQEVEANRQTVAELQAEIDRNRSELEGAWEHLRGEQRRMEEQQSTVLDEGTKQQLQELLDRLSGSVPPIVTLREQISLSFETIASQQNILNQHWQNLEQQRGTAETQQAEVDRQSASLASRRDQWQQAQAAFEQAQAQLQAQTAMLNCRQSYVQTLGTKLRQQEEIYQQIYRLIEPSSDVKVDVEALEKMPVEQLQQVVQDLQRELDSASRFVNDQEEELRLQQQTIDQLQGKLGQASDSDRFSIEAELADERDTYQFLNETLVGQRQNLHERKEILSQHQAILWRRQGLAPGNKQDDYRTDLSPIIAQVDALKQQQANELQFGEQEVEQLRAKLQPMQEDVNRQSNEQQTQRQELQSWEESLLSLKVATAQCWGRVNLYQEMLQPVQDNLDELRHKLETIAATIEHVQDTGEHQVQAVSQMRERLLSMMAG
ncbi:pilus motility taxis protein HmpF [Aliterella atlantica]|uniref:Uncharacterized protein n=1 Tax=Aliterella atlantica CENA595 TaxID=1618023 RepID=A0A0D9A1Z4_9CYAN|nr:pilus motility taxis protein HmpF [Aliterella atlantica]KJH73491.1 hypothetical protein UH38_01600 [Aliterella atlantica CENA595]